VIRITNPPRYGVIPAIVLGLLLILAPWQEKWISLFWFSHSHLEEVWRFLTAHLIHWSWKHWALNVLAFCCFCSFYSHLYTAKHLLAVILYIVLLCDFFLVFFYKREFYLGLSALIYGLFIYSSIRFWNLAPLLNSLIFGVVTFKAIEPFFILTLESNTDLPIATEMHLVSMFSAALLGNYQYFKEFYTKNKKR